MISRRSLCLVPRRRTKLSRAPLHVEALEARCLLTVDVAVAEEVVVPTDLEVPYCVGVEECFVSGEMMIAFCGFSEMTPPIEPQVETGEFFEAAGEMSADVETFFEPVEVIEASNGGEIDFSDLMFFSMALGGEELLPADDAATCDGILIDEEIAVDEEVVNLDDETFIDPLIFANFSVSSDDGSGPDVDPSVADTESIELAFEMLPAPELAEIQPTPPESTTPPPAAPTAQVFATFGQSPNSFAASLAAAFAGFGADRSASGDDDFIGGRRRGRR